MRQSRTLGSVGGGARQRPLLPGRVSTRSCTGPWPSFRDYAAGRTHAPHAVMEAALEHLVRNKAEAAYARSDLFEKRRALMESWADFLAA